MGGCLIDVPVHRVQTLVLVGRTGNGKSATGNTIIGRKAFKSRASSSGVTSTCELQQSVLPDGQTVNVIDTPGFSDITAGPDFIRKEIAKCMDLAKDGIHAMVLVFSVKTRFTEEEKSTIQDLNTLFGNKIINYMIVVFTGGDELEENDETLEDDYLRDCPQPLKDILSLCQNRVVLFNNKTRDEEKRSRQVQQLLSLVNLVVSQNDGKPYTDDLFVEMKKQQKAEMLKKQITVMIEERLGETIRILEQKLIEEQAARLRAEERAKEAQMKSNDEICKLTQSLEIARKERAELRKQPESTCTIL